VIALSQGMLLGLLFGSNQRMFVDCFYQVNTIFFWEQTGYLSLP